MTQQANDFISKKIKILKDEGYDNDQAVAIAYQYAREKGYDIPIKKKSSLTVGEQEILKEALRSYQY